MHRFPIGLCVCVPLAGIIGYTLGAALGGAGVLITLPIAVGLGVLAALIDTRL
jgi:hypothetical protein